ncbi:MAG: LPD7 domain-containing protein [Phenylobacterium sp.]
MAVEPSASNSLKATGRHSTAKGDVPEDLQRRYFVDGRGGPGLGFYVDATVPTPAFRDRGDRLVTSRTDPHVIRHLTAIARHRGWTKVTLGGEPAFRREAWLAARAEGLEVRGYTPTERDLQDLERRRERERRREAWETLGRDLETRRANPDPNRHRAQPAAPLKTVEAVVASRIVDPAIQYRLLEQARARVAGWLERGGRFDEPERERRAVGARQHGRSR